ncbi:MAG: hypothetical protein BroJett039_11980 [Chloroflexota bacterium]|nr:MAG: hypothetical protein BroJett039_11980 [Chloroflexota bacterium]
MTNHPLEKWHALVRARALDSLDELLAEEVVFYSPILFKPQNGKALTTLYLAGALRVLGNDQFHYTRELAGARDAMLEFETIVDGIYINGVDLVRWNDAGKLIEFKVMLRPLKGIQIVQQKMAELLAQLSENS